MKATITLLFIILYFSANAQEYKFDESTQSIIIQDVINSDLTKEDLYSRCRVFITSGYTDGDNVILLDDNATGILTTTARMNYWTEDLFWSLKLDIKDRKVRYTVSNIHFYSYNKPIYLDKIGVLTGRKKMLKRIGDTLHSELSSALLVDDW